MIRCNDGPDRQTNPHFIAQLRKAASVDRALALICRSGNRSETAGEALEQAGFSQVFNVRRGFEGELEDGHQRDSINGWRRDGLPWGQC